MRIRWKAFPHIFGALSLFSLSLSLTLGHLDFSWSALVLDQERQESKNKEEASKEEHESSNYSRILGRYRFACVFSLLYLACMVLHVIVFCLGMGFSRCDNVFSLAFPFLDSHGVLELSCLVQLDFRIDLKLSEVDLQMIMELVHVFPWFRAQ